MATEPSEPTGATQSTQPHETAQAPQPAGEHEVPHDPAQHNAWRTLAKALGVEHDEPVVRIPDLHEVLFEEVRYGYDQGPFRAWFEKSGFPSSVDPRDVYPEWRFNHQAEPDGKSGFSAAGRNSFLCVYAKLKHEGLWSEIRSVRWVGETGEITFFSHKGSVPLRDELLRRGYGDWWRAGNETPWGVRSRLRGAQLHFRGFSSTTNPDNVHIDLHNPGDPSPDEVTGPLAELPGAIQHFVEDLHNRHESHQWHSLRAALEAQKIWLPPIVP